MQASRHSRRIYVGNLPPSVTEQEVTQLFARGLAAAGATEAPGCAVSDLFVNHDKHFAFVELRTPREATNMFALEGLSLKGYQLSFRRPHEFNLLKVRYH
jgi:splicing factor U2AF 65 kDa subunit